MGVSVATVRRMAADGRIGGTKRGRQWLIEPRTLPNRPARRRHGTPAAVNVAQALTHVKSTDLSELLVPDVLRFEDFLSSTAEPDLLRVAESRFAGSAPDPAIELNVDKTAFSTRPAVLLSLQDRVAYQAAVASIAARVEAQTPTEVFSARLSTDTRYFLKHGTKQWVAWRRAVHAEIAAGRQWMIKTDLTSYFDLIPHRTLNAEIQSLNPSPAVADALDEMFRAWAFVPGAGVPQGPNASRLLGNLYLLPVDRVMLGAGYRYFRYLDDVRIVAATKGEAVEGIRLFERECRALGLVVSNAKTELLHGKAALDDLADDPEFNAVEYFMDVNATGFARRSLKKILKRALRGSDRVDVRAAKFSLWRLARLREETVLSQVLRRLEDLAPVASLVAAYLLPFIQRPRVVAALKSFLADPERCHSPFLSTWLFAAMLEHPTPLPGVWADQAMARVRDRNQPAYLRSVAAVVAARANRPADIAWIRSDVQREHDPYVLRGYAVGLHAVVAFDRTTQRRLVSRDASLANTVAYLQGRLNLPSLVYRERRIPIR